MRFCAKDTVLKCMLDRILIFSNVSVHKIQLVSLHHWYRVLFCVYLIYVRWFTVYVRILVFHETFTQSLKCPSVIPVPHVNLKKVKQSLQSKAYSTERFFSQLLFPHPLLCHVKPVSPLADSPFRVLSHCPRSLARLLLARSYTADTSLYFSDKKRAR